MSEKIRGLNYLQALSWLRKKGGRIYCGQWSFYAGCPAAYITEAVDCVLKEQVIVFVNNAGAPLIGFEILSAYLDSE